MKALITGASSGLGKKMAEYLSEKGYDLLIVARRKDLLEELKESLKTNVEIEVCDVTNIDSLKELFNRHKDIDVLINNAGFGEYGSFTRTSLDKEIAMINTNITALHVLTKLYLQEMTSRNHGIILNVASIAGFMPGPFMATYYASKSYVVSLSKAVNAELKKDKSHVRVSVLCPGPIATNFFDVAGVTFSLKILSSEYVAKYAIDKMLKGKEVIVPGFFNKITVHFSKFIPWKILTNIIYKTQKKKQD